MDRAEGTRRLYRLHDEGIEAVRAYLEQVWGDTAAHYPTAGRQLMEPLELEFTVRCDAGRAFEPHPRGRGASPTATTR